MLRKLFARIYYKYFWNSAWGHRFRMKFRSEQLFEVKPLNAQSVISDLFVWRVDDDWNTTFQLFNISSFLFPEEKPMEHCEVIFFDLNGRQIGHSSIPLKPFEMKTIDVSPLVNLKGMGTFSIFHYSHVVKLIATKKSHLTERGYIAYHRKNEKLKSFCHGNMQSLSKSENRKYQSVVGVSSDCVYHPQLILSDCHEFELIYTNPTLQAQAIILNFYDKDNKELKRIEDVIKPLGVQCFKINNDNHAIHVFKNSGKIVLWRPAIFKYYSTHFDVMHG